MSNVIEDFLAATGWRKFATSDFVHYLNRKGMVISEADAVAMLSESLLVSPTADEMWSKSPC